MSWKLLLFAGIPEQILFFLIIAVLLGKTEIFNIKDKNNVFKILITTCIIVSITALLKSIQNQYINNLVVQLIIFTIVFTFALREKWYKVSTAISLFYIFFIIFEYINFKIVNILTGITTTQCQKNEVTMILVFTPLHIFELAILVSLYVAKFNLFENTFIKLTSSIKKRFTILNLLVISAFITALVTVKIFFFDITGNTVKELLVAWFNVIIMLTLSITISITSHKFIKSIENEKKNNIIQLAWFKTLLSKNNNIQNIKKEVDEEIFKKKRGDVS